MNWKHVYLLFGLIFFVGVILRVNIIYATDLDGNIKFNFMIVAVPTVSKNLSLILWYVS